MIELIYIHIPKTGGVSLSEVINHAYGLENVAYPWTWLGMTPESTAGRIATWKAFEDLAYRWKSRVTHVASKQPHIRVLQGHMPVLLFKGIFPEAKRISWVRNPVDRVWSNYIFDKEKKQVPKNMTIEEYVAEFYNGNLMYYYLGGNIDQFYFIGVLEYMRTDILRFCDIMSFNPPLKTPHLNKSKYREKLTPKIKDLIISYNTLDMQIYEDVLERAGHYAKTKT